MAIRVITPSVGRPYQGDAANPLVLMVGRPIRIWSDAPVRLGVESKSPSTTGKLTASSLPGWPFSPPKHVGVAYIHIPDGVVVVIEGV